MSGCPHGWDSNDRFYATKKVNAFYSEDDEFACIVDDGDMASDEFSETEEVAAVQEVRTMQQNDVAKDSATEKV